MLARSEDSRDGSVVVHVNGGGCGCGTGYSLPDPFDEIVTGGGGCSDGGIFPMSKTSVSDD